MINLSGKGLRKRDVIKSGKNEECFLEPLKEILLSGSCPAENWKNLYFNEWSNNVDMLYKTNYFKS